MADKEKQEKKQKKQVAKNTLNCVHWLTVR